MMSSGLSLVTGHVCTSVHKSPFVAPDQCLRGWQPVDAPGAEKCLAAGTRVPRGGWTGHGLLARLPTAVLSWSVWCHGSDVLCRLWFRSLGQCPGIGLQHDLRRLTEKACVRWDLCVRQAAGQELSLTENRQGLNPRLGGFQQWYGRDFAIADSTG